jgi:predicted nucleic acid-binding Zn ribbon protein
VSTWRPTGPAPERETRAISASLERVARRLGAPPPRVLTAVFSGWEQLVGPEIAAHACPKSLRAGVLVVVVDQPAWAAQLRFMASDLLIRIRAEADAPEVTKIDIRTGLPGAPQSRSRRPG